MGRSSPYCILEIGGGFGEFLEAAGVGDVYDNHIEEKPVDRKTVFDVGRQMGRNFPVKLALPFFLPIYVAVCQNLSNRSEFWNIVPDLDATPKLHKCEANHNLFDLLLVTGDKGSECECLNMV